VRLRPLYIALGAIALVAGGLLAIRYWPRTPLSAGIASSTAIYDRSGRLLRLTLAHDQQYRLWTRLEDVSPEFVDALLLHEDQHFYRHPGFNPGSLLRASASILLGEARVGGSTLTMQLARLMYGLNTRTVGGKLRQIACAVWLEMRYSKHDLLEAHINLMPYGGNVQGVGAASRVYFGKSAAELGLAEALSLVLIPQAPSRRDPAEDEPLELRSARQRLFQRWQERHPQVAKTPQYISLPLQYGRLADVPFIAPHFTDQLLGQPAAAAAHELHSTLDIPLQRLIERVLHTYVRERQAVGIRNAAALLVDSRDMAVRALVGSADFHSAEISGQVNGTLAKRSPGSALKPFIYALGIDQGLIHPLTVLKDAPTSFGPFSPENFDGRFVGPITATDALIRSRNVPAVALSAQLAQPSFYQFLRSAGIADLASEQHYGLALTLGGGEVTMEELAVLYAVLANRGQLAPVHYLQGEPEHPSIRLLSEEASFMTLEMLKSAPRPQDAFARRQDRVRAAWKTGTSWGFRDAWTAGSFGPYVLVVWIGNFDGHGNPAFVGAQAAAPLFFRMTDALAAADPHLSEPIYRMPPRLARVEVCSASGDLPNADCPQTSTTWYLPGVSPIRVSQVHRRLWIDARSGQQACPPYDSRYVHSEVFEFWPTDLMQLFAQAGVPRRRPPPSRECARDVRLGTAPQITSPLTSVTYSVRAARVGIDEIPLAANADSEVRRLHWFVDDAYVGTGVPGVAMSWNPGHAGNYMVRAVDDRGRADSRALNVDVVR
jgi:penicillin-binding protein 1C